MLKLPPLQLLLVLVCCSFLAATFGFQQSAPPLGSRTAASTRSTVRSLASRQQQIRQTPLSPSFNLRHRPTPPLCAFGGGGGLGTFDINPPIETKKDAVQRIQLILTGTVKQFISGFTNGYLLALVWGLIRGPSLNVDNRGIAWGLDFGVFSALFSGTDSVTKFVLALPTKQREKKSDCDGNSLSRQQKASLWSVVIRNMILALYFGRSGGIVKMVRTSLIYGGLTYFFVGKKAKRDTEQMSLLGGHINSSMGGGQSSSEAMKQLLMQMMATNGPMPSSTPKGTPQSSPSGSSSAKSTPSASSRFKEKEKSKKENVVDVEFEKIDGGAEDDAK